MLPTDNNCSKGKCDVLQTAALLENLDEVLSFVTSRLEAADCSIKLQMQIQIAVEEIFVNIAHYAYDAQPGDATVTICVEEDPKTVEITFSDNGMPFDPTANPDPDVTLTAEQRKIGGLGIYMVKKSMDSVTYRRENGCNILTIRKQI